MDGVTITESRPNELLAALHESAHAEREYLFASRDAQPDDLILVAWSGSEAVGYLAASDEETGGLLVWEHVVVPDHRGQGIGERLLLEAVRRTRPAAVVEIDPMAELDRERVVDYYGRLGFRRRSARRGLWATATDVMRRGAARHGRASEPDIPISAIIDAKAPSGVVTLTPEDSVSTAISVMNSRRIGAVVVSTDGRRVEGIFSERDVLAGLDAVGAAYLDRPLAQVCTTDVVTCTAQDPVAEVMEWMSARRIRHVPVTSLGRLVGIVSVGDFVHRRLRVLEAEAADRARPEPASLGAG